MWKETWRLNDSCSPKWWLFLCSHVLNTSVHLLLQFHLGWLFFSILPTWPRNQLFIQPSFLLSSRSIASAEPARLIPSLLHNLPSRTGRWKRRVRGDRVSSQAGDDSVSLLPSGGRAMTRQSLWYFTKKSSIFNMKTVLSWFSLRIVFSAHM